MAEIETLGILDEIRFFVSDKLQVVSYKWLSRNFLISSNAAKRLLQEFIEKYGDGFEVIYSLSGWLKNSPTTYHIRLVSKHMLSDAKQEFNGNCSIQVYSIQACLPKDPATLWNHEFVQAEDLFRQTSTVENCLLDNRFCGVSNPFVKRTAGETPLGSGTLQVKSTGLSGLSSSFSINQLTTVPQSLKKKVQKSSSDAGVQPSDTAKPVKTEDPVKLDLEQRAQQSDKEKVPRSFPNNKKDLNGKNTSGTGGALANMWGRASTKPKPDALVQANNSKQNSVVSAEAQICARESTEFGSSDEEGKDFNIKRTSNGEGSRKRRVVFDYSDEEDEYPNAVNLSSPDPPKKLSPCSKSSSIAPGSECNLSFEEEKENRPKVKDVKEGNVKANEHLEEKVSTLRNCKKAEPPTSDKTLIHVPEKDASSKNSLADVVPKRRKVVKTRIDERGREVTEVVWEGEEPDTITDKTSAKTAEKKTVSSAANRPPVVRKSPAVGGNTAPTNQAGKAGNKKGGNKDPKQGNILSFFKKA
ncbi:hypothetical protein ACS0TY_018259 [Phlomoides rotata]